MHYWDAHEKLVQFPTPVLTKPDDWDHDTDGEWELTNSVMCPTLTTK